jgi:uncharacterized protein (DUF433 family)
MATVTDRITKDPNVCGGDACIRGTRVTIWGLVRQQQLGATDEEILRAVQGLTLADLQAAWQYAHANGEEINQAIRENGEEGFVE